MWILLGVGIIVGELLIVATVLIVDRQNTRRY